MTRLSTSEEGAGSHPSKQAMLGGEDFANTGNGFGGASNRSNDILICTCPDLLTGTVRAL